MPLTIEELNHQIAVNGKWVCRGPEKLGNGEFEHTAQGPDDQTTYFLRDDAGFSWMLCLPCARRLGRAW